MKSIDYIYIYKYLPLNIDVFSGAFVVLMAGLFGAMTVAFLEFLWVFRGVFAQRNVSKTIC